MFLSDAIREKVGDKKNKGADGKKYEGVEIADNNKLFDCLPCGNDK